MRRVIIAIVLISVSVYSGVYSLNKTKRICNNMTKRTEAVIELNRDILKNGNHDKRIKLYNEAVNLHDAWEESSGFFYFFFNNENIRVLELNFEKVPFHAKNGDLETAYLCLVECTEELEYLKNSTKLNFDNVF